MGRGASTARPQVLVLVSEANDLVSDLLPRHRDDHVIRLIVEKQLRPVDFARFVGHLVSDHR